jgi:hypothetical protein
MTSQLSLGMAGFVQVLRQYMQFAASAFPNLFANVYDYPARKDGGDRLRQKPERSSRCMPGYLMQLVKKRRETQLPITMNWLSLPN